MTRSMNWSLNCVPNVSPLQGEEMLLGRFSWGFTPGFHMTGFQPADKSGLQTIVCHNSSANFGFQPADGLGLKARDVIAQAEGLGMWSSKIHQAL